MAVRIVNASNDIHGRILQGIRNGSIRTWYANNDGSISHTGEDNQWSRCARMIPAEDGWYNILIFENGDCVGKTLAQIYGVYHGRFIEMLCSHFNRHFDSVSATSQPNPRDQYQRRNGTRVGFEIEEPR